MKRTTILTLLLFTSASAAIARQGNTAGSPDKETILFFVNAIAILASIWMASFFLLSIVRLFLNYRLRKALVENNASEGIIKEILPPKNNLGHIAIKWCCLFAVTGAGFTVCYFSQPIGLHWAIILSFSLALGLLIFYFISKRLN